MELSQTDIRRIARYGRSALKAPTIDTIVAGAFKTLKGIGGASRVAEIRLVYSAGDPLWREWLATGKGVVTFQHDERPAPPRKSIVVPFDTDTGRSGYISVMPGGGKVALATEILAAAAWSGILLHAALERVQKAATSETEIVRESLRARDEERRRISRELHDDLGQSMVSLKLSLKWAEDIARKKEGMTEVVSELSAARDSVRVMLGKLRDLSHTLYPRILDTLGLFAAVQELAMQVKRHSSLDVKCTVKGKERPLTKDVGVALYRCCQESISNAVRHAKASNLDIQVRYSEKEVRLTVEDNGKGFNPRSLYDTSGKMMSAGFWTIRQRTADLGGAFRLGTAEGHGTVIEMMVPYSSRENNAKRKDKTAHRG